MISSLPLRVDEVAKCRSFRQGTCEQLIKFLVDEQTTEDPSYVEDFLLTSRIFLQERTTSLTDHLMLWFSSGGRLRDKVRLIKSYNVC